MEPVEAGTGRREHNDIACLRILPGFANAVLKVWHMLQVHLIFPEFFHLWGCVAGHIYFFGFLFQQLCQDREVFALVRTAHDDAYWFIEGKQR